MFYHVLSFFTPTYISMCIYIYLYIYISIYIYIYLSMCIYIYRWCDQLTRTFSASSTGKFWRAADKTATCPSQVPTIKNLLLLIIWSMWPWKLVVQVLSYRDTLKLADNRFHTDSSSKSAFHVISTAFPQHFKICIAIPTMDWFVGENLNRKPMGFLPSNWSGFPVQIFPSSNSMTQASGKWV